MTFHQQKQIEIINQIERQIKNDALNASSVLPVSDFDSDQRMCLTSVHFPKTNFLNTIHETIIKPLQEVFPQAYYYSSDSLHLTIKNMRVIEDPPTYTPKEITSAREALSARVPLHTKFAIYPYRLLLFKNNLALMSTTDAELDCLILDLTESLRRVGIVDDKKYINSRYFFSNMTLARFSTFPPQSFRNAVETISSQIQLDPYILDSVSLITSNAVMKKRTEWGRWELQTHHADARNG